jgi:hypothetical protein
MTTPADLVQRLEDVAKQLAGMADRADGFRFGAVVTLLHEAAAALSASPGAGTDDVAEAKAQSEVVFWERKAHAAERRIAWLEGTALPHARKQENANGFQKGWHAALSRMSGGESFEVLSALVPEPSSRERVRPEDARRVPQAGRGKGAAEDAEGAAWRDGPV